MDADSDLLFLGRRLRHCTLLRRERGMVDNIRYIFNVTLLDLVELIAVLSSPVELCRQASVCENQSKHEGYRISTIVKLEWEYYYLQVVGNVYLKPQL
jgi:hypothetical protein